MIFIIISNIGLALMTLLLYMRYSHFRISYGNKIKELSKTLKEEREQKKNTQAKLESDYKNENEQVKALLREIEESRKERQEEIRLRLAAEKEIEVSKEKILQVQKRVEDWKLLQEGAINDSRDVIMRFGQELLANVKRAQQEEENKTRNILTQNAKSIEDNVNTLHSEIGGIDSKIADFKKRLTSIVGKQRPVASDDVGDVGGDVAAAVELEAKQEVADDVKPPAKAAKIDEFALKLLKDVLSLVEASGLKHMKDYIVASKLDENRAKYMLCDLFLLVNGAAYFVDFKAEKFFVDYNKAAKEGDEKSALANLQKKLDKYVAYISNPKYAALIKKLLSALKIDAQEFKVVFAVKNYDDTSLLNKIGYSKKIEQAGVELMDVNAVNDLIL